MGFWFGFHVWGFDFGFMDGILVFVSWMGFWF